MPSGQKPEMRSKRQCSLTYLGCNSERPLPRGAQGSIAEFTATGIAAQVRFIQVIFGVAT
jgi:hypothetical protein